ncbi:MAG: BatA domain-containing protein [Planctomycetota bacterium]
MGLLAPLYAIAALAIAGPIVFHLIRRQPRGQTQFSSLRFLKPTPPKLTQRSRLDNLLLLLLRALALGLIALAFMRPYFREASLLAVDADGRNVALLVDTSGSMQRESVWRAAMEETQAVLADLAPGDSLSLYTIDRELTSIIGLQQEGSDPLATQQAVKAELKNLKPTWRRSRLAEGISGLAELMDSDRLGEANPVASKIVLISDLQRSAEVDSLQGFAWPDALQLDVRVVRPDVPGNARLSLMAAEEDSLAVRIQNSEDALTSTFEIAWADVGQSNPVTTLQVPPGQVRIVEAPANPGQSDRLLLSGDAWDGDNIAFYPAFEPTIERIVYVGGNRRDTPEEDPGFFLAAAPLSTATKTREVERIAADALSATLSTPDLRAVFADVDAIEDNALESLRKFAEQGGTVVLLLASPVQSSKIGARLASAFQLPPDSVAVEEAKTRDFALLGRIDYQSSVFAPFVDPRFNDFSKIRFWSHRRCIFPEDAEIEVLAAYDDDSPYLLRRSTGEGTLWLMTAGWQPSESGVALSTKFIPILSQLLDPLAAEPIQLAIAYCGDELTEFSDNTVFVNRETKERFQAGEATSTSRGSFSLEEPGLYTVDPAEPTSGKQSQIAAQMPTAESDVVASAPSVFEQFGINLGTVENSEAAQERARQLQVEELERKQRVWQWLLAAGLFVLALETLIAGWKTRQLLEPTLAESQA